MEMNCADSPLNPDLTWQGDVTKCASECAGLKQAIESVQFDYNAFLEKVKSDNGLSSVPTVSDMQDFRNRDDAKFLEFIRKDCEARLEDVRNTNTVAKSVSAFMSIPALIGFLSKLAFYENPEFHKRVNPKAKDPHCGIDKKSYVEFVNRFMLGETAVNQFQRDDGVASVLYKMVRCGLLHGGTLSNDKISDVRISITHNGEASSINQIDSQLQGRSGLVSIVIDAESLCKAIEGGIKNMFETSDVDVIKSAKEVYVKEAPIIILKKDDAEGDNS